LHLISIENQKKKKYFFSMLSWIVRVPVESKRFVHAGKQLDRGNASLHDYNIGGGATVRLLIRASSQFVVCFKMPYAEIVTVHVDDGGIRWTLSKCLDIAVHKWQPIVAVLRASGKLAVRERVETMCWLDGVSIDADTRASAGSLIDVKIVGVELSDIRDASLQVAAAKFGRMLIEARDQCEEVGGDNTFRLTMEPEMRALIDVASGKVKELFEFEESARCTLRN
jgi:hypothetical protein